MSPQQKSERWMFFPMFFIADARSIGIHTEGQFCQRNDDKQYTDRQERPHTAANQSKDRHSRNQIRNTIRERAYQCGIHAITILMKKGKSIGRQRMFALLEISGISDQPYRYAHQLIPGTLIIFVQFCLICTSMPLLPHRQSIG